MSAIELRGDCRHLFSSKEHEVILCGPADSGKTVASIVKIHATCCLCPGAQCAIVRKLQTSLAGSVVRTFLRLTSNKGIVAFGGENPTRFIYPNGSVIWLGGMDNSDKVLSSERDLIYVNQAEELTLNDWETLATRCSGRASIIEHPQLFGDCNPSGSKHWIRERAKAGTLRLLNATHRDNPTIFDAKGNLLPEGEKRLAVLNNLSGVRRKRLLEGIWSTSEGAVYDMFDASQHVCRRAENEMVRFYLTVDEGYTNPAVILLIGEDGDGRWHIFREFYRRGVLQEQVVKTVVAWSREFSCVQVTVDAAAAGLVADLLNAGLYAVGGKGRVNDGIARIQNRLKIQGDGRPRLTVDPSCENCVNEFESYVWKPEKDVPVKEFDHSLDAIRYLADVLGEPTGALRSSDDLHIPELKTESDFIDFDRLDVGKLSASDF